MLDKLNLPVITSIVIYLVFIVIIFLSNTGEKIGKDKQMLFYYSVGIILPIIIYVSVISLLL